MAFRSWLMSTGADLGSIARTIVAGGDTGTLADLYAQLRSDARVNAWPSFSRRCKRCQTALPMGRPVRRWHRSCRSSGHLAHGTVELAAKVFSTILAISLPGRSRIS